MSDYMTDEDIEVICKKVSRGAKLYFGRDHAGREKIKLIHGPFGIFTERYQLDNDSMERLKTKLRAENLKVA
jgi:hypothetical protein